MNVFFKKSIVMLSVLFSVSIVCSSQTALQKPTEEEISQWAHLVDASGISRLEYAKMPRSAILQMLVSKTSSSTLKRDALCDLIAFEDKHPNIGLCKTIIQQTPKKVDAIHAEVSKEQEKEDVKKRFNALRAALAEKRKGIRQ